MDPAGLPALLEAIRRMHGVEATWLESVPVHEQRDGKTLWSGVVQVFAVKHPKATRAYAWSLEYGPGKRRFHAVLGILPVNGPERAVKVALVAEARRVN